MKIDDNPILLQIGKYLSDTLQMELLNTGHISSEALFNSIKPAVDHTMSTVTISVNALFYAKYVNSGRRAGCKGVPIDALVRWIRQRKIDLKGKREKSVAFAIQASIKRKGIAPAPFIDKSADKFNKSRRTEQRVERFMSNYLDEQLKLIISNLST